MKQICVIGLGYIGLPTSSILAAKGYQVLGVDVSRKVVDTINSGKIHITEPDLDLFVRAAVQSGKLRASLTPENSDVFIIAVPTPFKTDKKPDMSFVQAASESLVKYLQPGNLVILESTSPPGTCENIISPIIKKAGFVPGRDVYLAHCPERVLPGQIMREVVENDRVIGGLTPKCAEVARQLYSSFVKGQIHITDSTTAEMVKLVENSFRDVNIAFANELSIICERLHLNVWELIKLANLHPRVNILRPGPGVGGHCMAVDPWFIVDACPDEARLIKTARQVNDSKPGHVVNRVAHAAGRLKNPVIGVLGLSYKQDIDDLRESPAVEIAHSLKKMNIGRIMVCEPFCQKHPDFELFQLDQLLREADILLLLVAHQQFRKIAPEVLKPKIVIDTCGIW